MLKDTTKIVDLAFRNFVFAILAREKTANILACTKILNKLGTTNIYMSSALQNNVCAVVPAQVPLDHSLLAV